MERGLGAFYGARDTLTLSELLQTLLTSILFPPPCVPLVPLVVGVGRLPWLMRSPRPMHLLGSLQATPFAWDPKGIGVRRG